MDADLDADRMRAAHTGHLDWRALRLPIALFVALSAGVVGAWSLTCPAESYGVMVVGLALAVLVAGSAHLMLRQRATLEQSEARFRDFAEAGSDWFWEMGPDLRFVWLSDNFQRCTGMPPAHVQGKRRSELGTPTDNPEAWAAHLATLDRREPFQGFVYYMGRPDGSGHWTRTSGKPMFAADGRFLGYRGTSTLCTEQVAALSRAQAAEARLHAALGAMADGFALFDDDDRLILWNEAYRDLVVADPSALTFGTSFETLARSMAKHLAAAQADPQGWVARRMEQHRDPKEPLFRDLSNGRRIRVLERRTPSGSTVTIITDVTELHRREQAVADSEARYALAFRGANEGVWEWDLATGQVYGSERLWQLIGGGGAAGWRPGDDYVALMHPDDAEIYRTQMRAHLRGEAQFYEAEYRMVLPGGQTIWIRSRGLGVKSADGKRFLRMAGSAADVTAAKEAEFRLRRSEADLKAILDSARAAFLLLDRDGRVRAINRAGHVIFQRVLNRDILPGTDVVAVVPEEERAPLAAGIQRALSGDTVTREYQLTAPEGAALWLEISYTPVRQAGGEIDGVCWTIDDVTERRRAVDALTRSEERFRSLVHNTRDVFGIIDTQWVIRYVSDSIRRVLGYEPAQVIGQHGGAVMHPEDRGSAAAVLRQLTETADAGGSIELRFAHANGGWRRLELNAINRLADPAVRGIIVTARDVTARRAAEAELRSAKEAAEDASRAKTNFLATVSHELRTPLNAIIGFSEIMREGLFGPLGERYRAYAGDINQSGIHLLSLINDILDVSKAEAGKLELLATPFELRPALEECLRLVRDRAAIAELDLGMRLPEALPRLNGDERKVKQIVLNLLSNAVKFTNPGGRVDLSVRRQPSGELAIVVADNGIGIAKQDMTKALAAFGQVDSALNRKYVGTGLGLSLVQAFAKLHDAGFELSSAPEVGTTVTVTFPAERVLAA